MIKQLVVLVWIAVLNLFASDLNGQTIEPAESVVSLTAVSQGLQLLDQAPPFGTFWLMMPGATSAVPLPMPPGDHSLPIFEIADGQYLVDQTANQVLPANGKAASVLAAQADAVVTLI